MKSERSCTPIRKIYDNYRGGIVLSHSIDGRIEFFFDGFDNAVEAKEEILSMFPDEPIMQIWSETFLNQGPWEHV